MFSEDVENELEALRSIYGEDFQDKPQVWKRPCFSVRVIPTTSTSGEIHVEATLKFTLVNGYPKVAPKVEVESNRGLSISDLKTLHTELQNTMNACIGQEMCHDVISRTQQFLEANNVKPQTFYEAMMSREERETEALKNLREKDISSDGGKWKGGARKVAMPTGSDDLPAVGVINTKQQHDSSLLDASALDFKQSTEFITQQRQLSKAGKKGKVPLVAASTGGEASPVRSGGGSVQGMNMSTTDLENSNSIDISSLNASVNSSASVREGKTSTRGTKSWLKLFVNQGDDGEISDGDGEDLTADPSKQTGTAANQLVPVIGRSPSIVDSSRYNQEFHEMSQLGSGASGQVWKVRNKLDRRIYAVKKIDLNAAENASVGQAKIRREVTTISRLLHKHIVRYYAAWVEESQAEAGNEVEDDQTASMTVAGASSTGMGTGLSSSSSSAMIRKKLNKGTPEYLAAVVGAGGNKYSSYGMDDLGDDFSNMYSNKNPDELWTFEEESETSATATAAAKKLTLDCNKYSSSQQVPTGKKKGFFSYGDSSSSDDDDDMNNSSSGSSSSDDDSDSDNSSASSGTAGVISESGAQRNSSGSNKQAGANNKNKVAGSRTETGQGTSTSTPEEGRGGTGRRSIPRATSVPKLRRWMFIQMEYCYTTLREVIDQGQLWQQPAECGKLLRQMLEALVYIHDRRVIHRDLKPANIFLDAEGNIKIGDFGLATFTADASSSAATAGRITASGSESNLYHLREGGLLASLEDSAVMSRDASSQSLALLDASSDALSNSLTGGIGTAMYRAPEQEYRPKHSNSSSADKGYDDKADMFSLGVILFEMCHPPFGTGMERLLVMKRLRENAELPSGFGEAYSTEGLGSVVCWLVQQQPSLRPSASELLASELVPARVDTDSKYLREITEALWKPNSCAASEIISVLFNNSSSSIQKNGPPTSGKGFALPSRPVQDSLSLSAISYDLELLQHSLNALQPRKIPKQGAISLPANATKAAKLAVRQALQAERAIIALQYTSALKERLRLVFESHGAAQFSSGLLQLRSNPGLALMLRNCDRASASNCNGGREGASEKITPLAHNSSALAQFLDPAGQVVVLPSDLVTPFAKLIAFLNLQHSQRYTIGQVFTSLVPTENAAIEDAPVAAAARDHPIISEEAVYDVVLPLLSSAGAGAASVTDTHLSGASAEQSPVLQAEFEVLSASIEAVSRIQSFLPDCAIRVNDPRIMDSIIELCLWDPESGMAKNAGNNNNNNASYKDQYDREALFKVVSLASDGVMPAADISRLINELRLSPQFKKRFLAFVPVLSAPQDPRASQSGSSYLQQSSDTAGGRDPLQMLDALEQEFYRSDVIVDIQRRLASGNSDHVSSAGSGESKKKKNSVEPPPPSVPATAAAAPVKDFTQLDLAHIGKKQQLQQQSRGSRKGTSVSTSTSAAAAAAASSSSTLGAAASSRGSNVKTTAGAASITTSAASALRMEPSTDDVFREDRKRIRIIIKTFDSAVTHLRQLVKAGLNCLYGMQQYTNSSPSSLMVIVDLGKDPRYISTRAGSSMLCPFHSKGVYFVIESYLFPSEQFMQQHLQQTGKDKAGIHVDPSLLLRCSRRRHNRFGGVLGEGGHFEHLVEAYRDHFQDVGGPTNPRRPAVTACAVRFKLDLINQLFAKFQSRQQKIADHILNRGSTAKYHFIDRFRPSLSELLSHTRCVDVLLAMDAVPITGSNTSKGKDDAGMAVSALQSILLLLRRHGIRVSDRPHQLQGASHGFHQHLDSAAASVLCAELGIPFVVALHAESGNKLTLQYCSGGGGSASSQVSVSVLDLPIILQECVAALQQQGTDSFQFLNTVIAAGNRADAARYSNSSSKVRSPGRNTGPTGSGSGSISGGNGSGGAVGMPGSESGAYQGLQQGGSAGGVSGGERGGGGVGSKSQRVRFGSFDVKNPSTISSLDDSIGADTPSSAPKSRTNNNTTERIVHIVILDAGGAASGKEWQQYNNAKEKKLAVTKKKELEQVPHKVRALLLQNYAVMFAATGVSGGQSGSLDGPPNFTPINRSTAAPYSPGLVLVVDAPFHVLRSLNSILLTKLRSAVTSSIAREEYEALAGAVFLESGPGGGASTSSGNYRKVLKQVLAQLLSYARQVVSHSASTSTSHTQSGGGGGSSSSSSGGNNNSSSNNSNNNSSGSGSSNSAGGAMSSYNAGSGSIQLYLYSQGDHQMDFLTCDAKALLNAKFVA